MKTFEDTVEVPVEWTFCSDGRTLRSTVVCGFQGEIYKGQLKVICSNGSTYSEWTVDSRDKGMKKFKNVLRELLRGR